LEKPWNEAPVKMYIPLMYVCILGQWSPWIHSTCGLFWQYVL